MKMKFELEDSGCNKVDNSDIAIIGIEPKHTPYVRIQSGETLLFIPDKDLERFAVNILKALGKDIWVYRKKPKKKIIKK